MKKPSLAHDYLMKYAASLPWEMHAASLDDVRQVVVIPAYAEKEMIFATLASLAENPGDSLKQTLIICVINNKADAPAADRENNSQTLCLLQMLIDQRSFEGLHPDEKLGVLLSRIRESAIRLACMDASSSGLEIPSHVGGVGMARKIGMDMALRLLQHTGDPVRLILSLDADTLVSEDYLPVVRNVFASNRIKTAVVSYEHRIPPDADAQAAICGYEIFLRYFLLGLRYAESPYAFHSIGSTMATTADAYLAVRGMNRREAGEDFYFLNKLAKLGPIRTIRETRVYPSSRISVRVPFGTGAAMDKIASGRTGEQYFYDPRIFQILKEWIGLMEKSFSHSENEIMNEAEKIHPGLAEFLTARKFPILWPKIRSNLKDYRTYKRQFQNWFDGFETLKLINHLTRKYYPRIAMLPALRGMRERLAIDVLPETPFDGLPRLEDQVRILHFLRTRT